MLGRHEITASAPGDAAYAATMTIELNGSFDIIDRVLSPGFFIDGLARFVRALRRV